MELEERKVLHPRTLRKIISERNQKEWWYTGVWDPANEVYVSWHFIRVNLTDQLGVTVFDKKRGDRPAHFDTTMKLEPDQPPGELSLIYRGRDATASYTGSAATGWRFEFAGGGISAELDLTRPSPASQWFTKFDNTLSKNYGLLHFFHNRATGTVITPGNTYSLSNALVYYDHCFGTVPRQTGWHWLAVQNETLALASLVNYGPYAQRYSQVWFGTDPRCPASRHNEWIRLEQSVSFEHESREVFPDRWCVTSSDLDLKVSVLPDQYHETETHIPPLTRAIVDLHHTEAFVKAEGKVRVDGCWVDVGEPLWGVMEQHHGKW